MFCNQCGAANADGSRFCSARGKTITSSTPGGKPADPKLNAETEMGLPEGTVLADRYRIIQTLGVGGMGRVYLAEDQKLETRVAIKVLREVLSRDPSSVKRLIAEARHSMTLAHPNVVRVHNFEDGELVKFLVMEYVEGETLAQRIADQEKLPEAEARRIAVGTCMGLEHAHEKKVIHRDIKPGNILLGKSSEVKIADFGIARQSRDSISRLTSLDDSGTRIYMSPEQPVGEKLPNRFGLYDMLGNVWEWCQNWYDDKYYEKSPTTDPMGPTSGYNRVLRGGSWWGDSRFARVSHSICRVPVNRDSKIGFRVCREKL